MINGVEHLFICLLAVWVSFCEVSKYPKSMGSQRVGHNWMTELNWYSMYWLPKNIKIVLKDFPG